MKHLIALSILIGILVASILVIWLSYYTGEFFLIDLLEVKKVLFPGFGVLFCFLGLCLWALIVVIGYACWQLYKFIYDSL